MKYQNLSRVFSYKKIFRLAEKAWSTTRDQTAKAILEQVDDLLEDLGEVEQGMRDDVDNDDWETDDEEMES